MKVNKYSVDINVKIDTDEKKLVKSNDQYITVIFREISNDELLFEKAIYDKLSLNKSFYHKIKNIVSLNSKISTECILIFKSYLF